MQITEKQQSSFSKCELDLETVQAASRFEICAALCQIQSFKWKMADCSLDTKASHSFLFNK